MKDRFMNNMYTTWSRDKLEVATWDALLSDSTAHTLVADYALDPPGWE